MSEADSRHLPASTGEKAVNFPSREIPTASLSDAQLLAPDCQEYSEPTPLTVLEEVIGICGAEPPGSTLSDCPTVEEVEPSALSLPSQDLSSGSSREDKRPVQRSHTLPILSRPHWFGKSPGFLGASQSSRLGRKSTEIFVGRTSLRTRRRRPNNWLSFLAAPVFNMRFAEEASLFAPSTPLPTLNSALQMKVLKGEDRAFASIVKLSPSSDLEVGVYAVFDGHNGPNTAHFCKDHLLGELLSRLPKGAIPPETDTEKFQIHLLRIRQAVASTFTALDSKSKLAGCRAGCTASLLLVTGWLATVANVGDSDVVVQTTKELREVSTTHRLNENDYEIARLEKAGHLVAQLSSTLHGPSLGGDPGIGPMRVWPGGLCVARAIGDGDVGTEVLPEPHIKQMRVPDSGARFALATDGVWDGMPKNKVGKLLNSFTIQECAREVVRHSLMRGGLTDDTSLVLVDVLPPQTVDFSKIAPSTNSFKRMMCMSAASGPGEEPTISSLLYIFASADMAGWEFKSDLIRPLSEDFSSDDSSQHYVDPSSFKAVDVTAAASMQKVSQKALITNDISLRNIG